MKLFKTLWKKWKNFARIIGNFQARVLFTIFYFILLFPIGIALGFFSDTLNIKAKKSNSNFNVWDHPAEDLEAARKPY